MPVCRRVATGPMKCAQISPGARIADVGTAARIHQGDAEKLRQPVSRWRMEQGSARIGNEEGLDMAREVAEIHSGSSFEEFLEEQSTRREVESAAIKRVL